MAELYDHAVAAFEPLLQKQTTRSSIRFAGSFDGSRKVVISLLPGESDASEGLRYQLYKNRYAELTKLPVAQVESLMPVRIRSATSGVTRPEVVSRAGHSASSVTWGLAIPCRAKRPNYPTASTLGRLEISTVLPCFKLVLAKQAATGPRKSPMRDFPEARQLVDCADRAAQPDGNVLND